MSTSKPVVVYGASGYTGRLVAEYLREYGLPFIAAGRSAARVEEALGHVPGIETADYDVREVEHTVDALTELFSGAKVVCNTVGPFALYGAEVVEACISAGCHYVDTNGEQDWMIRCDENYGQPMADAGRFLLVRLRRVHGRRWGRSTRWLTERRAPRDARRPRALSALTPAVACSRRVNHGSSPSPPRSTAGRRVRPSGE